MNKKKSLAGNAVLNGIKSVMSIIFPLITFPYISRILKVENVGIYNFSMTYISYFALLASLGINTYAIREGVKYRTNRKKMCKFSTEILTINLISTVISYLLLFLSLILFKNLNQYSGIILILSLSIFFTTIGCEWIYSVYEDYLFVTIRSILFQIMSLLLLILFVKNQDDLYIYAFVTVFSSSFANIINFLNCRKYFKFVKIKLKNLKHHLSSIMILFANSIAVTIYGSSDITILGLMTTNYHVGIYSVSVKIYSIFKMLVSSILTVAIPRLSFFIANNDKKLYNKYFNMILNYILLLGPPIAIGIIFLSKPIIMCISGNEYLEAAISLNILGVTLIFCIIGWLFSSCVLIVQNREKVTLLSFIVSALLNIALNILLIPYGYENATAFTTLLAEAVSMCICIYYSLDLVEIHINKKSVIDMILGCIAIMLICVFITGWIENYILQILFAFIFSVIIYFFILCMCHNVYMFQIIKFIKLKTLRRKI